MKASLLTTFVLSTTLFASISCPLFVYWRKFVYMDFQVEDMSIMCPPQTRGYQGIGRIQELRLWWKLQRRWWRSWKSKWCLQKTKSHRPKCCQGISKLWLGWPCRQWKGTVQYACLICSNLVLKCCLKWNETSWTELIINFLFTLNLNEHKKSKSCRYPGISFKFEAIRSV